MIPRKKQNNSIKILPFLLVALSASLANMTVIDASDRNHGEINQWFGKLNDEKVTAKAWEFLQAIAETKSN